MEYDIPYEKRRSVWIRDLTNEEYERFFKSSQKECIDLIARMIHRSTLLDMGKKRVPKHRYRKDASIP